MVALGNIHVYLKYGKKLHHQQGRCNKKLVSPILLLVVVVVRFRTLYLKNHKEFKSETLHTGRVP